ncbi:pyrroline-5-carboxylate reductase [Marinicauda salina]|uniref:Pyrroline-5-carboxylate reductase n=1 Tax=Marinicauda salina TaxID=2135793 RepID=A0A2U2BRP9_9PROT|nr:pyrroline-5-carboxylate reductase [Marinicauda salina]PWE16691.1 pyrroline-5-carboxylate reductase [Marinicauda salina]
MSGGDGTLALIGAGRMGSALAAGWLAKTRGGVAPDKLVFVDPQLAGRAAELAETYGIRHVSELDAETAKGVDRVVLAVKPGLVGETLDALAGRLPDDALVISVAAGVPLKSFDKRLAGRPVVRAMPNTPAAIGKGVTVCVANEAADDTAIRDKATKLLKAGGQVEWVDDERLLGAVTGVSGSGPAYVFLFCEALAAAGEAEGLPRDLAERLAVATVSGAGAMLEAGDGDARELRRMVTSPGGTTQAGLDALMAGSGLPSLVRNAVSAAERRSRQLGNESE